MQNTEPIPAKSIKTMKLAMTAAIIIIAAMGPIFFSDEEPASEDVSVFNTIMIIGAIVFSVGAVVLSRMARKGAPTQITAMAMFETITLLALVYSVINTEAPFGILVAAAVYSIAGIWLVVPNQPPTNDGPITRN